MLSDAAASGAAGHPAYDVEAERRQSEASATKIAAPPLPRAKPKPPQPGGSAPVVEASAVMGLSETEVEILLGPPQYATIAPPARIRDYEDSGCKLRLYLYVDLKTQLYRVLHLETSAGVHDVHDTGICLTRLAQRMSHSMEP
jgi:hypothetical protein